MTGEVSAHPEQVRRVEWIPGGVPDNRQVTERAPHSDGFQQGLLALASIAPPPTPLIWHTAYFASVGVSWLVVVGQSMWLSTTSANDN